MTFYIEDTNYRHLVETLTDEEALDKADPHDRRNAIKIILGEHADIWPRSLVDTSESNRF